MLTGDWSVHVLPVVALAIFVTSYLQCPFACSLINLISTMNIIVTNWFGVICHLLYYFETDVTQSIVTGCSVAPSVS